MYAFGIFIYWIDFSYHVDDSKLILEDVYKRQQQTVMEKQNFPWKRCLNGQRMPMIYVLYPYVILMHVEHIQMERLGKLTIRKHT